MEILLRLSVLGIFLAVPFMVEFRGLVLLRRRMMLIIGERIDTNWKYIDGIS